MLGHAKHVEGQMDIHADRLGLENRAQPKHGQSEDQAHQQHGKAIEQDTPTRTDHHADDRMSRIAEQKYQRDNDACDPDKTVERSNAIQERL